MASMGLESFLGQYAGMGKTLVGVVIALLVVAFIGMLFYFLVYRAKAFDTKVQIFSERAGDIKKIYFDRARFTKNKENGAPEIVLQRSKAKVPSVYYESLFMAYEQGAFVSKNGKAMLIFRETAENVLYPISKISFPNDKEIEMTAIPNDLALLAAAEKKYSDSMFDKPKMWEKILPIATIGLTGVFVLILVWFALKDTKTIATAIQGVAQVCQTAANAV